MSLTLGEKIRQAREAKGASISEVAEQTRISALYLESIENNDYRGLPGGIFNKGFVKSYAKYVGLNEQDALQDYTRLIADQGETNIEETKTYRPEVLTDDRSGGSMIPTIIFAVIILGLLSWAAFAIVGYLRDQQNQPVASNNVSNSKSANTNNSNGSSSNSNTASNVNGTNSQPPIVTGDLNVQFKSISTETLKPTLTVINDGKPENYTFQGAEAKDYTSKQTLKINYSKYQAGNLQMTINGKPITLPSQPLVGKGNGVNFEINKNNVAQILQAGAITAESVGTTTPNANTNTATNAPR